MTELNEDFIMPLVKEHFKQGGVRDDGTCSEYYGSVEDFIKFSLLMYSKGMCEGAYQQSKRYMEGVFDD